LCLLST